MIPFTPEDVAIGQWLSAALENPNTCDEFKRDINNWFESKSITIRDTSEEMKEIEELMWKSLRSE